MLYRLNPYNENVEVEMNNALVKQFCFLIVTVGAAWSSVSIAAERNPCGGATYPLQAPYSPEMGSAFIAKTDVQPADDSQHPAQSHLVLCENKKPLGPAHSSHDTIRKIGRGAYSHWITGIYFSTSDNSNPNTNGRKYFLAVP